MGKSRTSPKRVTTAVRLPEDVHRRLQEEAEARDVSMNYLVTKAANLLLEKLTPLAATERELGEEAT